jgi:outer membrane protein assembly factor BamB
MIQSLLRRLAATTIALTILIGHLHASESPDPNDRVPAKGLMNLPTRNMVNLIERDLPTHWSAAPDEKPKNIKWSIDLGTKTFGSPVVADGRIFVATNNGRPRDKAVKGKKAVLMALRESDGKFLWQIAHDCPDCSVYCPGDAHLLMCTPTVDGERIYYATPVGEIICAACANGKILWRHHALKDLKEPPSYRCAASPLVFGDLVFVTNGNGVDEGDQLVAPKAPCFLALNKQTGKVVWESRLASANIIVGQWSSPTVAVVNGSPQVIYAGGDGVIYGFEPATGKLLWQCDCLPTRKKREPFGPIDNYFVGNPVVVGTRLYIGMGVHPDHQHTPRASWFLCLNLGLRGDVSLKSYDAN